MKRLFIYSKLLPTKYIFGLLFVVVISVLTTYFVCQSQNQTLRLRNQFLEQRYVEQMKSEVDTGQPVLKPVLAHKQAEEVFESRDGSLLTKVFWSPDDYGFDVETIDLVTQAVVAQHTDNSYYALLRRLQGFDIRKLLVKTENTIRYAVFESLYYDAAYQIFVASLDEEEQDFQLESFLLQPTSAKTAVFDGRSFIDYYPKSQQLLINSGFFDGCGGSGKIILLSRNGSTRTLQEYGSGCALLPRYLGYLQNELYFAEINLDGEDQEKWEDAQITGIFSLNPLTQERRVLNIDFANYAFESTWKDAYDRISATELVLFEKTTEEGYALDVNTLGLRNMGKLFE